MTIPSEVKIIIKKLQDKSFEAYIVGGCVRDLLLNKVPKDWDIATEAKPEEIQKIFPESVYENQFGTVAVRTTSKEESLKIVEITTFRQEGKYTDKRHPDEIKFAKTLEEDLSRRDFTVNAIALTEVKSQKSKIKSYEVIDPFGGQKDLKNKVIRAVGNPEERFNEDALRLLRAVRFACELNFVIEAQTLEAIKKNTNLLRFIAKERIRDEFIKIIDSQDAAQGIKILSETGLLEEILPEIEEGIGVTQNKHHIYDIFEHSLKSLQAAADKGFNTEVRMAALLHDIGKPETKEGEGPDATFYNHDYLGAKFAARILNRLRFPKKFVEKVVLLVRNHMFVSDPERLTEAGARRLIRRIGMENISDLINLRIADRLGMGRPKERPYRLRTIEYLIEKVSQDPISVKMLKINGDDIMSFLKTQPGPKIGAILDVLLAEVIEDPKKNNKEFLKQRVLALDKEDLNKLRRLAKGKIEEKKEEEDLKIKEKYWIK